LLYGIYRALDRVSEQVYCFEREANRERLVVALNFGASEVRFGAEELTCNAKILMSTHLDRTDRADDITTLRSFEGLIIKPAG
jgi:hypothetical protein